MQVEGTKEAFIALISQRGIYKFLDVDRSTVANWKAYIKAGKSISLDKMEEMLIKAGASVVSEKVWEVVVDPVDTNRIKSSLKPNEIRIGNFVQTDLKAGTLHSVDASLIVLIESGGGSLYRGILINEKWLVKLGFTKRQNYPYGNIYWDGKIMVAVEDEKYYIGHPSRDQDCMSFDNFELRFVHQLQNAVFGMTGEELTIKST